MRHAECLRVAFLYDRPPESMPPYVHADYEALCEVADVTWLPPVERRGWRRGLGPKGWLPGRRLLSAVRRADVVVQWFADTAAPAIGARIVGRPLLLIVGGYDTACEPRSGYGLMLDRRWRLMIRTALNLADRVLALSEFQLSEVLHWAPKARAGFLHLGVDATRFRPVGEERENLVLTSSRIGSDWVRKGLETLVLTAVRMPDVRFAILGGVDYAPAAERLRSLAPSNFRFLGGVPHNGVPAVLARARVYAQLSSHESFCLALAEAMAAGCSPVVTECGALPEVAGDSARYVPPNDPEAAAAAIRAALSNPFGALARQRAIERFPAERRATKLMTEIRALARPGGP